MPMAIAQIKNVRFIILIAFTSSPRKFTPRGERGKVRPPINKQSRCHGRTYDALSAFLVGKEISAKRIGFTKLYVFSYFHTKS